MLLQNPAPREAFPVLIKPQNNKISISVDF